MRKVLSFFPAILLFIVLIIFWEVIVSFLRISERILPTPSAIVGALYFHWSDIYPHVMQTLLETIIGLCISIVLGIIIAIFIDSFAWSRKAVYPLLVTSQTIPLIALAPLLLLWFGFDITPKIIMVVLYCFFPITVATIGGFSQVDEKLVRLLRSMDASSLQILTFVRIPSAIPSFFSGLKIAVTYSVAGAIVGEYVGAYLGLGSYIQTMSHSNATVLVFAAILVTALLSMVLFASVLLIEHIFHARKRTN